MSADRRNEPHEDAARRAAPGGGRGSSQQRLGILRNPNRAPLPPPRRATLMGKWPSLRSSRRAQPGDVAMAAQALAGDGADAAISGPARDGGAAGGGGHGAGDDGHTGANGAGHGRADPVEPAGAVDDRGRHPPGEARAQDRPKIDVARLMADVEKLGEKKSTRSAYGAAMRAGDAAPPGPGGEAGSRGHAGNSARASAGRAAPALPPLADAQEDMPDPPAPSDESPAPGPAARRGAMAWALAGLAALGLMGLWLGG